MKTPRLFSSAIAKDLLPETIGAGFQSMLAPIAESAGNCCEITGFPYPSINTKKGAGQHNWMMIEAREEVPGAKAGNVRTLLKTPEQMTEDIKRDGVTKETARAICPLVFWSRHVDLAINHRRGQLIFAPWITQSELLQFFRALMIASTHKDIPAGTEARQTLSKFGALFGNGSLLSEVTAYPENLEWSELSWLTSVRRLPPRERRTYLQRFAVNLRFWPNPEAFKPLAAFWNKASLNAMGKESGLSTSSATNPWISHYQNRLQALQE